MPLLGGWSESERCGRGRSLGIVGEDGATGMSPSNGHEIATIPPALDLGRIDQVAENLPLFAAVSRATLGGEPKTLLG
jgi:hypothetical protein